MDVLVITNLYPPHAYGGYETSCRDVVDRWRAAGHRVTVLTTDARVADVPDDPAETGVRRELAFYWVDHELPRRSVRERLRIERTNAAALGRALDEVRPQVVSAWALGALSLGLLNVVVDRGLPLVLVLGDEWLVYGEKVDRWRRPLTRSRLLARAAGALTGLPTTWPGPDADVRAVYVSETLRDAVARDAPWHPAANAVAGPGIDHRDFPVGAEVPDRPWSWRLLQVGRLDPRKGLDHSVQALAMLPGEARLDVVGRGDSRYGVRLRALAEELGVADRVRLEGARPRAELASVYAAADVALFPVVWQEPFGIVPLEAMACGTPVVATGTGGSASFLVDGGNCLLVPPGDPAALARAVRRLADEPALRRALVQGGLATAAAHGTDSYADRLEAEHRAAAGA